jgi:hypothetical protein
MLVLLLQREGRDTGDRPQRQVPGYKKELYGDAVQALYTELK